MATIPNQSLVTDNLYTRVVNNLTTYLIQNVGNNMILVSASDSDLGATSSNDLGGYKLRPLQSIDNSQLQDYPYVYIKAINGNGAVRV